MKRELWVIKEPYRDFLDVIKEIISELSIPPKEKIVYISITYGGRNRDRLGEMYHIVMDCRKK